MTVEPVVSRPWWMAAAGMPPRLSSGPATRSTLAAGFLVVFVLGSTGIAAAVRHENDEQGMRQFCASYRSMTSLEPIRDCRPSDLP